jgi:hypothetical protein
LNLTGVGAHASGLSISVWYNAGRSPRLFKKLAASRDTRVGGGVSPAK